MSGTAASWWESPGAKDEVKAHTPDETKYWLPDERQSDRMRSGINSGTVIPRANDDGTSKGFDGRVAGVVHVDPDAPDGGAVVDLSQVRSNQLYGAFSDSTYPHEVYYKLQGSSPVAVQQQQPQASPAPAPARVNPLVPDGTYVVPDSNKEGLQVYQQEKQAVDPVPPLPPLGQPAPQPSDPMPQQPMQPQIPGQVPPAMQMAPQQPQYPQQVPMAPPQPPAPVYSQPQDGMQQIMGVLGQLTSQVNQLQAQAQAVPPLPAHQPQPAPLPPAPALQTLPEPRPGQSTMQPAPQPSEPQPQRQPPPKPLAPSPEVDEDFEPQQTLEDLKAETAPVRDGMIIGFEELDIPFIKGPKPEKARKEVYFEIPNGGTMAARYHQVVDGGDCLALVYDTRYEDGHQYLPPDLGATEILVTLPRTRNGAKKFACSSMGIHFNVGVMDIVVLIKHRDVAEGDFVEDEED